MGGTKGFPICPSRPKTDSCPTHPKSMQTLFIFVFLIIQQERLRRASSCRGGLITHASTRRCFFSMPRTKRTYRSQMFHIPFLKFPVRETARWNFAVFPRTAGLRAYVADSL